MERSLDGGAPAPAADEQIAGLSPDGAAPTPPPHHVVFTTSGIAPEGKFETWRDLWVRNLFEMEMSARSPETFDGTMELWNAGPVSIASLTARAGLYERTPSQARNGSDDFGFALSRHGFHGHVDAESPKAGQVRIVGGGSLFMSHDQPFTIEPSDHSPGCLLRIDRKSLLELMPRDFEITMQPFAPGDRLVRLIEDMVPVIASRTEPSTPDQRANIALQIIDVVALLLNPSRDGRALIENRGLRAARRGAVLRIIDTQFARGDLSAETIGPQLGITGRQVHRLLEETTKTFSEHLLERRLLRARELLTSPTTSTKRIAEIAYDSGFADVTHFSYAFRRRFGDTPRGVRVNATKDHALHTLHRSLGR